jgi:hypothetical protein
VAVRVGIRRYSVYAYSVEWRCPFFTCTIIAFDDYFVELILSSDIFLALVHTHVIIDKLLRILVLIMVKDPVFLSKYADGSNVKISEVARPLV